MISKFLSEDCKYSEKYSSDVELKFKGPVSWAMKMEKTKANQETAHARHAG